MKRIQIKATIDGYRLFRNSQGFFIDPKTGARYRLGLGTGTSDLIGWKSIEVTKEMVGKKIAVFAAVEVKSEKGKLTTEQEAFLGTVASAGGLAIEARSESDLK